MRISDWSSDVCSSDLFLVAILLREGKLGGFHFNSRNYADDDLMVGAADPFQLFRIMHEIEGAGALAPEVLAPGKIGSASCRERVFQYVYLSVAAFPLKKKNIIYSFTLLIFILP